MSFDHGPVGWVDSSHDIHTERTADLRAITADRHGACLDGREITRAPGPRRAGPGPCPPATCHLHRDCLVPIPPERADLPLSFTSPATNHQPEPLAGPGPGPRKRSRWRETPVFQDAVVTTLMPDGSPR